MLAARLLAALLAASHASGPGAPPPFELGVASALEKLRPGDTIPGRRVIDLSAARGECESAQIAIRSSPGFQALGASADPLSGPLRLSVALYRVAFIPLALPSGPGGTAGDWPDPLVPERDAWYGERRQAFPVAVPPGRLQAIWVEVCVPRSAPAGRYAGAVAVLEGGRTFARIPLRLTVWPFALPATSTLVTAFGLSTLLGTRAVGSPGDHVVARALAAAALRHRVTPFGLSMTPPSGACREGACALDWTAYDAEMAPILDGTLVPGARGTFAEVLVPAAIWSGVPADAVAWLAAWRRHFEARGWSDRLWLYTLDEPRPDQLFELARRARLAHAAGIRVFSTTVPSPALEELVDAYAPNVTLFEPGGAPGLSPPGRGTERLSRRPGRPFWYVSCLSHGCAEIPEAGPARRAMRAAFANWPGYEIDRPGASARCMGWLAFRYGVAGELYYDMLQAWRNDPWRDLRAFAGNGDGTLLYPGLPSALGGEHPFAVESIRLKLIRDGLEDYELLSLAARSGLAREAERLAAQLVPSPRRALQSGAPYLAARQRLGDALARSLGR